MSAIKIKKESLAKRCEICHQSDYFEPNKNQCLRCENLIIIQSDKESFRVNLQVDLTLLANSLRNFAWQNLDSELIKATRRVLAIGIICSLIFLFIDHQLATTIDEYDTEGFTMWGCGGYYSDFDMFIGCIGFFSFLGIMSGLISGLNNAYFNSSISS
jgi:hypothetical protein